MPDLSIPPMNTGDEHAEYPVPSTCIKPTLICFPAEIMVATPCGMGSVKR